MSLSAPVRLVPKPSLVTSNLAPTRLLFSRKEAATILCMSLRKLDTYTASGLLKVRRIGGSVLIHYDTLVAFASQDQELPAHKAA